MPDPLSEGIFSVLQDPNLWKDIATEAVKQYWPLGIGVVGAGYALAYYKGYAPGFSACRKSLSEYCGNSANKTNTSSSQGLTYKRRKTT